MLDEDIPLYENVFIIYINGFKIKLNGEKKYSLINKILNNNSIYGVLRDKKYDREHLVLYINNEFYSLTTAEYVIYADIENKKKSIKTEKLFDLKDRKNQRCLKFDKGETFDDRFILEEKFEKEIVDNFYINNKYSFTGFLFKNSIYIESTHFKNKLIRGRESYIIENKEIIEKNVYFSNEVKNLNNEEFYNFIWNELTNDQKITSDIKYNEFNKKIFDKNKIDI